MDQRTQDINKPASLTDSSISKEAYLLHQTTRQQDSPHWVHDPEVQSPHASELCGRVVTFLPVGPHRIGMTCPTPVKQG